MKERLSQKKSIREHLDKYRGITPLVALKLYGCYRLAARIKELRMEGMDIKTERVLRIQDDGSRKYHTVYRMVETWESGT